MNGLRYRKSEAVCYLRCADELVDFNSPGHRHTVDTGWDGGTLNMIVCSSTVTMIVCRVGPGRCANTPGAVASTCTEVLTWQRVTKRGPGSPK